MELDDEERKKLLDIFFDLAPDMKKSYEEAQNDIENQWETLKSGYAKLKEERERLDADRALFEEERKKSREEVQAKTGKDSSESLDSSDLQSKFRFKHRQEAKAELEQCHESMSKLKANHDLLRSRFEAADLQLKNHEKCCTMASEGTSALRVIEEALS